jgi:hypothetical protein
MLAAKHGALMFDQSGGCCDGSALMCYPAGEFRVGGQDVLPGAIVDRVQPGGVRVWIGAAQFGYWRHTQGPSMSCQAAARAFRSKAPKASASSSAAGCSATTKRAFWKPKARSRAANKALCENAQKHAHLLQNSARHAKFAGKTRKIRCPREKITGVFRAILRSGTFRAA